MPAIRDRLGDATLNSFLLLLNGDGEERQVLRQALNEPRRQRAVGVCYKKDTEATSHYVKASLSQQFDAYMHVDTTTALAPLD